MEFLIRFVQVHETFRRPELEALAVLANVKLEFVRYEQDSPFCVVRLDNEAAARAIIKRSILSYGIYALWGQGLDYPTLHRDVQSRQDYVALLHSSFRFNIDCYLGKRSQDVQTSIIESFQYMAFQGGVRMRNPDLQLYVFEDYSDRDGAAPTSVFLGREIAKSDRDAIGTYSLKTRRYISRTSMDAELSLVTANIVLAAPGKILYDPFVGTGSFSVTGAHFGSAALGSDIDGRSIRGIVPGKDLESNFVQYNLMHNYLDSFIADLTHTPLRRGQYLDGIICDPPYGVREGPKVLGYRGDKEAKIVYIDGVPAHMRPGYIAPKQPYGFDDMLHDILNFSFAMLVDNGRLCMWMPTANEENVELGLPSHPGLELLSVSVQDFNKWSRRLLTFRRLPSSVVGALEIAERPRALGNTASELNHFREKYFRSFRPL